MTALIVFFFILAVVMVVLGCLDQRMLWWKMAAWRYRNPHAQEPSDGMLSFSRVSYFFGAAILVVFGIIMAGSDTGGTWDQGRVRSSVESAAGDDHSALLSEAVDQAIEDEAGDALKVTKAAPLAAR